MEIAEYLDHVNAKEDLLKFLVYLQKDFKENRVRFLKDRMEKIS